MLGWRSRVVRHLLESRAQRGTCTVVVPPLRLHDELESGRMAAGITLDDSGGVD